VQFGRNTGSWPTTISQLTATGGDGPYLKTAPSATLTSNGYAIASTLGANGAAMVVNSTANSPNGVTYDVSGTVANPCTGV
jgi:hypothetical protein